MAKIFFLAQLFIYLLIVSSQDYNHDNGTYYESSHNRKTQKQV